MFCCRHLNPTLRLSKTHQCRPQHLGDTHNTTDDSVATENVQPEIATGVTYTIQAFHGILQAAARQVHLEEKNFLGSTHSLLSSLLSICKGWWHV